MQRTYTKFLQVSLSRLLRQGNRISIGFGRGSLELSVSQLRELKRTCDEVSDLLTAIIAHKCTVEEHHKGFYAALGDKKRSFKSIGEARRWLVHALCGRRR